MIVKTHAIVLRIFPFSETSRVVTWLTSDYGKISTLMKGSQRYNSLFLGQFDFFYTCQLLFYLRNYQGIHIVKECSPLELRASFRTLWKATACASYVADIASRICPFHAPHKEIYQWLESALDFFAVQHSLKKGLFWFELKLLEAMGLSPQFNVCMKCGRPLMRAGSRPLPASDGCFPEHSDLEQPRGVRVNIPGESHNRLSRDTRRFLFSYRQGGVYCDNCRTEPLRDVIEIDPDIIGILKFWQESGTWRVAQRSKCKAQQIEKIESILGLLLQYHLGINISSRNKALEILTIQVHG